LGPHMLLALLLDLNMARLLPVEHLSNIGDQLHVP
jgi:hypothetical protein